MGTLKRTPHKTFVAMAVFMVPLSLKDLLVANGEDSSGSSSSSSSSSMRIRSSDSSHFVDLTAMSMVQKNQHVQMCIQLLAHDDAAILTSSQDVFETVISATVAYQHIPDMAKSLLVDAMCSNLSVLNATLMSVS